MNKNESKQKLFEIIEKYQNDNISKDDVKSLTELFIKNNPYLDNSYNVNFEFEKLSGEDENTNAYYSHPQNKIIINSCYVDRIFDNSAKSKKESLINYTNTIFHELRHYIQYNDIHQIKNELGKEKAEQISQDLKHEIQEEVDYSKDFVSNFVHLFKEGFSGEFFEDFSDEDNIKDIVDEITHSFYYRDLSEYDARQSSIKICRGFIRDIYTDPTTPESVKEWCKSDAKFLMKIEENELAQNDISYKYNKSFHNLQIKPKQIKSIIDRINSITGKLETNAEKYKTQEAINARDNFYHTCKQCVNHLFKEKTLDELTNYYVIALVNPSFYSINITDNEVSLGGLNNDMVIKCLQTQIEQKLKDCSQEKKSEVSRKISKVSNLSIVMASLTSSHMNLNILTPEDKKSLLVNSICSYITNSNQRNSNVKEILNSFDPSNPQDKIYIEKIYNFYKQNYNSTINKLDTAEQKAKIVKQTNTLKKIAKNLDLNSLMNKFGKGQEFEEILASKPNLSPEERFNLQLEIENVNQYEVNKSMYGKTYANFMKAKETSINIKDYNADKDFISNSETSNMTI